MEIQAQEQKPVVFARLTKVDEEKRLVHGRAVEETLDRSGEIFDYETSKSHFTEWSKEASEASDGKSVGNLRAMHGKVAAGKLVNIEFDDVQKAIDISAHVVDDQEWKKVMEGVYTGFSIGGSYVKKWNDSEMKKTDGKPATRYTAQPSEISLVDRPCVPTAKFFDVQKADGSTVQVEFMAKGEEGEEKSPPSGDGPLEGSSPTAAKSDGEEPADGGSEYVVEGSDAEVAKLAGIMSANSLDMSKVLAYVEAGVALKKSDDEAYILIKMESGGELQKGMFAVRRLADICNELCYLAQDSANEENIENDKTSVLPDKLKALVASAGEALMEMTREEVQEMLSRLEPTSVGYTQVMALADKTGGMEKLEKREPVAALQKLHDLLKNSHSCACTPEAIEPATDLTKMMGEVEKMVEARLASALDSLQKANTAMQEKIEKLEAQPAPPRAVLKAVSKAADGVEVSNTVPNQVQPVMLGGQVDESATLIKQLHRQGGKPLEKFDG